MELISALMQQLHLSPRIGYAIYAAWNTIPYLKKDFIRIKHIHEIRRMGAKPTISDNLQIASTLIIDGIRHAERASISMSVRGIETTRDRTFIHESKWCITDTIYTLTFLLISLSAFILLIIKGRFVFGLG